MVKNMHKPIRAKSSPTNDTHHLQYSTLFSFYTLTYHPRPPCAPLDLAGTPLCKSSQGNERVCWRAESDQNSV
ncbi:hypothetical protein CY34DRAFT_807692 [Suillus luteus UH-Slu-Lm8-n1]|uniref:Uncharacterized protein n=1 Tax=Suillus luteus UH-Slu-Lm8-n1 TaxID=930992 RepID=A0A0D0APS1_9AGAM|nr:hypothetical protein CY34DRAFT_807692 [Suillus luteus UH-Slu-Lm8-n1]